MAFASVHVQGAQRGWRNLPSQTWRCFSFARGINHRRGKKTLLAQSSGLFIFLPAATCYPLWGWWKSRAAGGWSDMSAPNWGLAPLTELQPCQEPIIHLHISIYAPRDGAFFPIKVGFFYQIKYLHTKLCCWCQAGSASLDTGGLFQCLGSSGNAA